MIRSGLLLLCKAGYPYGWPAFLAKTPRLIDAFGSILKQHRLYFLLLWCCLQHVAPAQSPVLDESAFRTMSAGERYDFVQQFSFAQMDSVTITTLLNQMLRLAQKKEDAHSAMMVHYRFYAERILLHPTNQLRILEDIMPHLLAIEKTAKEHGFAVEELVGHFYATYEQFNHKKFPPEQMYVEVQRTFGKMESIGFEKFEYYNPETIFYCLIKFMQDWEDYEESYRYLTVAERIIQPSAQNYSIYTLCLNYLQNYWQQKKDYAKATEYAQKILHFNQHLPTNNDPESAWRSRFWQGFSSLSIAELMLEQGKEAEVEHYADQGYAWSKVENSEGPRYAFLAEYEALQVYIPIKLRFNKLNEAGQLLQRSSEIKEKLGAGWDVSIFKHIKFYENFAHYEEVSGHPADALHYLKLARTLEDSLERRNDARKFEQIKQRLAAEKYTEQIRLVESEKQQQEQLRNAAFVLLALVLIGTYFWFRRQRDLRRRKEAELEAAKNDLKIITSGLREKSELLENLRLEMEQRSLTGERSQYLEQLFNSTILTEDDWLRFRTVFEKVYPNFIAEQKSLFPGLTPAQLRYLVLEKLQLSTHEMANMLGVSDNTIRQTRLRLRRATA